MHSFPPASCVRAKPNTEPSQSSASNPIGTEKRHSVRVSCAGPRAGGGCRTGHDRRAPVEDRSRVAAEGLPRLPAFGFPTPSRSGARLQPLLYTGQPGAKRRKQVLSNPRSARRIGRLRPSISTPFAQQPGTPEPPGTPPQPPPDPTAPPTYEDPPRPIPIPRPDEPPVVDDPPPRRNAQEFAGPLSPAHHHIGLPAAAAGAHQPLAPIRHGHFGAP